MNSKNYVDKAEQVITSLINEAKGGNILTTTQLRKQLAMTAEMLTEAMATKDDNLPEGFIDKIDYLRVQFVYQAGREPEVKKFIEKAEILQALKSIGGSRKKFIIFCRYMEALVAYRKFLGKEEV